MSDKVIEQLKSLRNHTAEFLSEPYSDDDVVALDKAIAALERQREGWKLVPAEDRDELWPAWLENLERIDPRKYRKKTPAEGYQIIHDVLAAAPEPPK